VHRTTEELIVGMINAAEANIKEHLDPDCRDSFQCGYSMAVRNILKDRIVSLELILAREKACITAPSVAAHDASGSDSQEPASGGCAESLPESSDP
jgi:hypothetical protein